MSADTGEAAHWPALDGLRAIAVLGVLVFHVRTDWLPGGFLGVDLFFALSGYLITSLLLRDLVTSERAPLRRFWGRRFRRLLPAVMVMIALVLAWTAVWGTPGEQATARSDAAWAVPYLANWHLIDGARDYWASATADSPFTHLWSLAIEEQFYVVWPLVVWVLVSVLRSRRTLLVVTGGGAIASVIAMVLLSDETTRAYMGTDTRACALLFGALFALLPRRRWPVAVPVVAVVVLAAIWVHGGERVGWLLRGGLPLHSFAAAVLVASLAGSTSAVARALSIRPLVWIGRISYGLYLWHWPVVRLGRSRVADLPWLAEDVVLVATSFALAIASFHLVEHPIRRQLGWARGGRAAWATLATAAVATLAIVVAPTGRGHVAAFDAGSIVVPPPELSVSTTTATIAVTTTVTTVTLAMPTTAASTSTSTSASTSTTTSTTSTTVPPRVVDSVLWIGDSIAADEAPAVIAALQAAGLRAVNGAFEARRLISSDGVDVEELYPPLLADAAADVVVVQLSMWDKDHPADDLRTAFTWFAALVAEHGGEVVFVTPPPLREEHAHAGLARQAVVAQQLAAAGIVAAVLDSTGAWGDVFALDLDADGAPDRKPDGVHVCPQGAARFATWLVGELDRQYEGLSPAPPAAWAAGDWVTDPHYDTPVGACAPL